MSKILGVMVYDNKSKFENGIYISDAKKLYVGKCARINENVFLQGEISIGDYVLVAPNVAIYTQNHIHKDVDTPIVLQGTEGSKKVVIKDNAWLGRNVVVLPGITVGEGAIVGAGSVVTKDVEPYTIVGGAPAKLIRSRK